MHHKFKCQLDFSLSIAQTRQPFRLYLLTPFGDTKLGHRNAASACGYWGMCLSLVQYTPVCSPVKSCLVEDHCRRTQEYIYIVQRESERERGRESERGGERERVRERGRARETARESGRVRERHIKSCQEIETVASYLEVLLLCVSSVLAVLVSSSSSSLKNKTLDFTICTIQFFSRC